MEVEVVKGRYFTTPISIEVRTGGAKRGRGNQGRGSEMVVYEDTFQEPPRAWEPPTKKGKGKKGSGKQGDGKAGKKGGKGDGKGDALAHGCARQNKDGKLICFAFNSDGQLCRARKCKFLHVCGRCTTSNKPCTIVHAKHDGVQGRRGSSSTPLVQRKAERIRRCNRRSL
jgi:hypothetical protein